MNQTPFAQPVPIPSREEILGILRTASSALSAGDIAKALKVTRKEHDGFLKRLGAMERDGQLELNRKGFYVLANQANFVEGRVQGHRDGYGFVMRDDGEDDIYLSEREMQKAMHNDRVQVRVSGTDRRGRLEGQIVEILERANKTVIGRLLNEGGAMVVAPEDKRLGLDILIPPKMQGKAKPGQVVCVEITDFPDRFVQAVGKVIEVLGDIDDPGMEIEIAVRKYGVPHIFSPATIKEAEALPSEVEVDSSEARVDLRDIPLVTIDGEDARDFDDAVYCEPLDMGKTQGWRLIVAIADVSHYVRPGHPIDADAIERATSVYFPRRVIPMLPEKLSNGLCSLNPNVDRLCMVCDAVISSTGEIKAYQFYPAVMHSKARFTYNEVWAILSNTKGPEATKRAAMLPHLQNLYDLYHVLQKARQARGAIEFETTETYIVCNAQGKIEQILPRTRNDAHRVIEECMLAANVCAANFLHEHKHAALYRIHAGPTEEKLKNLRTFLRTAGLTLGGGNKPHTSDYAALMDSIKARPDATLMQTMMLRSMQQAVYNPDNIGHFGLGYEAYAHFTSPIRRYPDLLVHRAIKAVLAGKKYVPAPAESIELNTMLAPKARRKQQEASGKVSEKGVAVKGERSVHGKRSFDAIWEELGLHCSANERRADEASRDVENWLKCYFMRDKLGSEYSGSVSAVTAFGLFVQLDELFVEGLVHITELGSDYFQYDEARNELRGERTGIRYRLTDRVRVQVTRVDLDARKIDFSLVKEPSVNPGRNGVKADSPVNKGATSSKASKPFTAKVVPLEAPTRYADLTPNGTKKSAAGKPAKPNKAGAGKKKAAPPKPTHLKSKAPAKQGAAKPAKKAPKKR